MLGTTPVMKGRVQMLWFYVQQLQQKAIMMTYFDTEEPRPVVLRCRPFLAKIARVMGEDSFIAGEQMTWLDFQFLEILDMLDVLSSGGFYQEFPTMGAYKERMVSIEGLREAWGDETKLMKQPFNNPYAK